MADADDAPAGGGFAVVVFGDDAAAAAATAAAAAFHAPRATFLASGGREAVDACRRAGEAAGVRFGTIATDGGAVPLETAAPPVRPLCHRRDVIEAADHVVMIGAGVIPCADFTGPLPERGLSFAEARTFGSRDDDLYDGFPDTCGKDDAFHGFLAAPAADMTRAARACPPGPSTPTGVREAAEAAGVPRLVAPRDYVMVLDPAVEVSPAQRLLTLHTRATPRLVDLTWLLSGTEPPRPRRSGVLPFRALRRSLAHAAASREVGDLLADAAARIDEAAWTADASGADVMRAWSDARHAWRRLP